MSTLTPGEVIAARLAPRSYMSALEVDEAADYALEALRDYGYVVISRDALSKVTTVALRNETFGSEDIALAEAVAALDGKAG